MENDAPLAAAPSEEEDVNPKNDEPPPGEEVIANVLHILSSSTRMSPLLCGRRTGDDGNNWDPFLSPLSEYASDSFDSRNNSTHHAKKNFLFRWLNESMPTHGCPHRRTNLGGIMDAFVHTGRMDEVLKDKPDDDLLWHAGLSLLRSLLYPNNEDGRTQSSWDPIPPHLLLRTAMDSYYCNDCDLELGGLSATVVDDNNDNNRVFRLPSSIAMFYLRTYLISRALESAEESIPHSEGNRETVRWRRLKSMSDDACCLFRRMLFDYSVKAASNVRMGIIPTPVEPGGIYGIDPNLILAIATLCYTHHVFPSSRALLLALVRNETKSHGRGTQHGAMLLKSCYELFREMTTLLALDVALLNSDYATPSRCVLWVLKLIESQNTNDFFDCVKSQKNTTRSHGRHHGKVSEEGAEMHLPWSDTGDGFNEESVSLEEDLLLYPSIGVMQDKVEDFSTAAFYDGTGIAILAYWKVWAQAQPELASSSSEIRPLPSHYSSSYRWTLLFPHVFALLSGCSSPTVANMLSPGEERQHLEIDSTITSLGFDMLHTILSKTPAIRPTSCHQESPDPVVRWEHSSQGLESTISKLLSHVVRISLLEVTRGYTSSSDISLKHSSLEIMGMARTLIRIFNPTIQIEALSIVCQTLKKASQVKCLLPRVIDFIRPLIMDMCGNTKQYNHDSIAFRDTAIMKEISSILDPFLVDLHGAFDDLQSPLPGDVHEFMSATETYSAVFAIIRMQRIWSARCQATMKRETTQEGVWESFQWITGWIDGALSKLHYFDSSLTGIINIWETSEHPPHDWHVLFLMQSSLRDAFNV